MQKSAKLFGAMFAGFGVWALVCAAFAADATPRAASEVRAINRATMATGRMPSMPIMTINPINLTTNVTPTEPAVVPDQPVPDEPDKPQPECPDGGVRNSEYGVQNCMNDVLSCINNGALAGGLNDLFNEDMRNAIMNGMGLCSIQVEKCMHEIRRDCKPVYRSIADVWVDFNSRKIQPEYYNFVLRKTGLTPNQAENTCRLLDVNTYGPSFAAVANNGTTTSEYNNRVGAYNNQSGGVLIKTNPQGVQVNDGNLGVDGARGHYARWDATTATCYLRVAAYNKDTQIKNSWLFGALGDDQPAEVWRAAGDTFSCNKDLFGFSLMNDTSTAAVVGIGGGTLAGAGIGALAGHGKRAFDCSNKSALKTLNETLREVSRKLPNAQSMTMYLGTDVRAGNLGESECNKLVYLYEDYLKGTKCYKEVSSKCDMDVTYAGTDNSIKTLIESEGVCEKLCFDKGITDKDNCLEELARNEITVIDPDKAVVAYSESECKPEVPSDAYNLALYLRCNLGDCNSDVDLQSKLRELGDMFTALPVLNGEDANYNRTIPVGAAIGAGTGGVATAITAFVERNNINCRVGDGLNTVGFGKSHSIDTLKDFYVKWNLRVPDTIMPTATAVDCKSWKLACAQYADLNQCKSAALNYKPDVNGTITLVRSACDVSGSVCIENAAVAKSYGACEE